MTRTVMVLLTMLTALAVGACGQTGESAEVATAGGDTATEDTAAEPVADEDDRRRQFAECMREHGVDMPDAVPGEGAKVEVREGGNKEDMRAALDACREFLPNGGERRPLSPEDLERMRELAECMRANGVDMPDPDPNTGGLLIQKGTSGADKETMDRAFEACRHLSPKLGGAK